MGKFIKNNIVGFILGAVIFSTATAFAYDLIANNVEYTPLDDTWRVENVKEALDELYNLNQSIFGITSDNVTFEQAVNNDYVASKEYTASEEEIVIVVLGVTGKNRYSMNLTTTGTILKDTGVQTAADSGFYRHFRTAVIHLNNGESISVRCDGYVYGLSAYSLTHIKRT